jgi:hypothetical protein
MEGGLSWHYYAPRSPRRDEQLASKGEFTLTAASKQETKALDLFNLFKDRKRLLARAGNLEGSFV